MGGIVGLLHRYIQRIGPHAEGDVLKLAGTSTHLLFERFPELKGSFPWISLGKFPTPVEDLGVRIGFPKEVLMVKRDDLSSSVYGGNKVRKLEHLLADARLRGRKTLITLGGTGSNHALATALHGRELDFRVVLCLFDQPSTPFVEENQRGFKLAGARVYHCQTVTRAYRMARSLFKSLQRSGDAPYFIISGGTNGLSNLGHFSAMLELESQIVRGLLKMPDRIFVPVGTCGTMAGLLAGIKFLGWPVKLTGVQVVDTFPANRFMIRYYAQQTLDFLQSQVPSLPTVKVSYSDFTLDDDYLGAGYGAPTEAGIRAVEEVSPLLSLETTYTGKAMAACLVHCRNVGSSERILFWNTFNSFPVT
jgi:D-cysteine desulfhydrase